MTNNRNRMILIITAVSMTLFMLSCSKQPDYFIIGKQFMELQDYQNAVVSFQKAMSFDPKNASLRLELGKAYKGFGDSRKANKQFQFAARIGSHAVSDTFHTWGRKIVEEDPSEDDALMYFHYAVQANPKNMDALFEQSRYIIRYHGNMADRVKELSNLKRSLEKNSTKYVLDGTLEALAKNKEVLYHAFSKQLTFSEYNSENYGPVAIYTDCSGMVWVRSKRDENNNRKFFLCKKAFSDTSFQELLQLKEWTAFPNILPDTMQVVYSNGGTIFLYDIQSGSNRALVKGIYPALSPDGKKIAYVRNQDIYMANVNGEGEKRLWNTSALETLPRFSSEGTKIYFLTHRDYNVWLAVADTSGDNQKMILNLGRQYWELRDHAWLFTYDCRPDTEQIAFNLNGQLQYFDMATDKTYPFFYSYGRYPQYSIDGKNLVLILDTPEARGELWRIDLESMRSMNEILNSEKPDRKKIRKLLSEAIPPSKNNR